MPNPAFTVDEWRTIQFALLWIYALRFDGKKIVLNQYALKESYIQDFLTRAIEYADKQSARPIVVEILYSAISDLGILQAPFLRDTRSPAAGLGDFFSLLKNKLPKDDVESIRDTYLWIAKADISYVVYATTVAGKDVTPLVLAAYKIANGGMPTPPVAKRLPIYLLVDSSRNISDSASVLDSGINNHLCDHLRTRPKGSVPVTLGLIPINDISDLAVPLTEPAVFHVPSLVGTGDCQLGVALSSLRADLVNHLADSKPLVIIFLAGAPYGAWQKPAKQVQDLAKTGKINVIAIGSGALADFACLKEVGAAQPMVMAGITQSNIEQVFDWLYGIIDVIMSGLESGASGAKSVPTPPACLRLIP